MAQPIYTPVPSAPEPDKGNLAGWTPAPGNTISVVTFTRETTCEAQFEHPEGWSADEVQAAVVAQGLSIGPKLCWWGCPDETIEIGAIALASVLTGDDARREPISLVAESPAAEIAPAPSASAE